MQTDPDTLKKAIVEAALTHRDTTLFCSDYKNCKFTTIRKMNGVTADRKAFAEHVADETLKLLTDSHFENEAGTLDE